MCNRLQKLPKPATTSARKQVPGESYSCVNNVVCSYAQELKHAAQEKLHAAQAEL